MFQHTTLQLATVIALPIVTVILIWTLIIYHKNRRAWQSYDIPIVGIVYISTIRNLAIAAYITFRVLGHVELIRTTCGILIWLLNSLHTFQATCLTTLAVIGLFSIKLYGKRRSLRLYLTPSHVVYHLFCLTALCACVGIAAILAQQSQQYLGVEECRFMPYDLDVKFNVFIIVLHLFLIITAGSATVTVALYYCRLRGARKSGFDEYLKKSTSDLSDLSVGAAFDQTGESNKKLVLSGEASNANGNKGFYDTYTIQRGGNGNGYATGDQNGGMFTLRQQQQQGYLQGTYGGNWYSDTSNMSTTVSSTNSRRPLNGQTRKDERIRTGLGTIHPILTVCYIFYHLPIIVLSIFPSLIYPWDVPMLGLWLGLLQDLLIPVSLGLIDSRFCEWVSKVYRCGERRKVQDKVPHVGLDGKFRHFGSQPQSLEINQVSTRPAQQVEHKFPITNGSLYTSIDGRPFIHNYRRPKTSLVHQKQTANNPANQNAKCLQIRDNLETQRCLLDYHNYNHHKNSSAVAASGVAGRIHPSEAGNRATSLQQLQQHQQHQQQYEPNLDTIRQNLAALRNNRNRNITTSVEATTNINNLSSSNHLLTASNNQLSPISRSSSGIKHNGDDFHVGLKRFNRTNLRLSRSQDSLNDIQNDLTKFKELLGVVRTSNGVLINREDVVQDSDEEFDESVIVTGRNCGTMSSESCYSITTEANGDFEFYNSHNDFDQHKATPNNLGGVLENIRITLPASEECNSITGSYLYLNESKKIPSLNYYRPVQQTPPNWTNHLVNDDLTAVSRILRKTSRNNSLSDVSDLGCHQYKIKRSNSKRSLENFQAYVEHDDGDYLGGSTAGTNGSRLQKASSFVTLEEKKCRNNCTSNVYVTADGLRHQDFVSSFLVNSNNKYNNNKCSYVGSVPDLKKVFISEYI